jgi:hypothetical protein
MSSIAVDGVFKTIDICKNCTKNYINSKLSKLQNQKKKKEEKSD